MIAAGRPLMRAFPPGRRGVLIPLSDRSTAAAGICLYTASKPWVVGLQNGAFWLTRAFGARVWPGRAERWRPPCDDEQWAALVAQWERRLGPLTGFAAYRRRQAARTGITLLVTCDGRGVAVIKIRNEETGVELEQRVLRSLHHARPKSFRVPRALGSGGVGDLHWAAQECVFVRPHHAVLEAPQGLFAEVSALLRPVVDTGLNADAASDPDGLVPAHGDLTPWNLRRDHKGSIWLFDWEDVALAPSDADRTYFAATSFALKERPMPADLSAAVVAHWRSVLVDRVAGGTEDEERTVLRALEAADQARLATAPRVRDSSTDPTRRDSWK